MNKKKKGIVLIITMFLVVVIVMLIGLIMDSASSSLKLGNAYTNSSQAYSAALSGLEYAREQLYQNSGWMQFFSSNTLSTVTYTGSDERQVNVVEKDGQVKGYIGFNSADNNSRSIFMLRFKTPNGTLASSSFKDIFGQEYEITSESCNNLAQSSEMILSGNRTLNRVPAGKILIVSEGVSRGITKRAEALLDISQLSGFDASTLSKKDIKVKLSGSNSMFWIDSVKDKGVIRTPLEVSCDAKRKNCMVMKNGGDVYANSLKLAGDAKVYGNYGINLITDSSTTNALLQNEYLTDMSYDKNKSDGTNQLAGGAYIYNYSDGTWHRYNTISFDNKSPYQAKLSSKDSSVIIPSNFTFSQDPEKPYPLVNIEDKVKVRGDFLIAAVDNLSSMTDKKGNVTITSSSITRREAPHVDFMSSSSLLDIEGLSDGVRTVIQGSVNGSGKIVSNGSIYVQGGSYFETEKNSGVGIYADQDISIIPASGKNDDLEKKIEKAWGDMISKLPATANIPDEVKDGEIVKSAMDIAVDTLSGSHCDGNKTLAEYLDSKGCRGADQRKLLESIIAQNSSYLADDGTAVELVPEEVSRPDTFDMFNNAFYGESPGYGGFATGPYSLAQDGNSSWNEDDFIDWHSIEAGENGISKKNTADWYPGTRFSFATALSTPSTDSPNSDLDLPHGEYMVFWVHDNVTIEQRNDFNDLYICIPKKNSGSPVELRYCKNVAITTNDSFENGTSKHNGIVKAQISGDNLKNFEFTKTTSNNVNFKINMKKVFEALDVDLSSNSDYIAMKDVFSENKDVNWNHTVEMFARNTGGSKRYVEIFKSLSDDAVNSSLQGLTLKKDAIVTPTNNDTTIKGMIFTKNGNFNTDLGDGTLTVRGGIIAMNGGISLDGGAVNICYDPEYMNFITSGKGCVMEYLFRNIY